MRQRLAAAILVGVLQVLPASAAGEPAVQSTPPGPVLPALRVGLDLAVTVVGGARFEGAFVGFGDGVLDLSTREGRIQVAAPLLLSVSMGGVEATPEAFLAEVRRWSEAAPVRSRRSPPPLLVGGASLLWAGAGPAVLGDWGAFAAYSVVESALLGAGVVMVARGQYGPLLPIGVLDVVVRGWSVAESVAEARRRQRRAAAFATLLPSPGGAGGAAPTVGLVLTAPLGRRPAKESAASLPEAGLRP